MVLRQARHAPEGTRIPIGVQDYPPAQAAMLQAQLFALAEVFERHGYERVYTPWFELEEVLGRGLGEGAHASLFRLVDPGSGEVLVLRPDFTAQVARMVAARLSRSPRPLRLTYEGRVARAADAFGRGLKGRDLFQAGVELIGAEGAHAELEVLTLLSKAFVRLGRPLTIDLGHAGILMALAPEGLSPAARSALAARDVVAVRRLSPGLEPLVELSGDPGILGRAKTLLAGAPSIAAQAIAELEAAIATLERRGVEATFTVDLAEVRGLGYYTGLSFRGYVAGAPDAVANGGRYDGLLGRFGAEEAAVGFGIDVGAVTRSRAPSIPRRGWVISALPDDEAALAEADRRRGDARVVLVPPADAHAYARDHGYAAVVTLGPTGATEDPIPDRV